MTIAPLISDVAQRVPPELWLRIFEFATFVPGILDVHVYDPFDSPHATLPLSEFDWVELARSFATRWSIVRVSKLWHSFGLPFLYEIVALHGHEDKVLHLHKALVKSIERGDERPLGSLVRHIVLGGPVSDQCFGSLRNCDLIPSIMGHTSNLDILSIHHQSRIDSLLPSSLPTILSSTTIPPSLKKIYIHADMYPYLAKGFSLPPSLHTFVTGVHERASQGLCPVDLLTLPNLSFLAVGPSACAEHQLLSNRIHADDTLVARPALTQALFVGHAITMAHFLSVQGEYLTTVHLDVRVMYSMELERSMDLLADHCPHLTHLIVSHLAYDRRGMPPCFDLPPTITHLGLEGYFPSSDDGVLESPRTRTRARNQASEKLFMCLARSVMQVPGLKVVRFFDDMGPERLKEMVEMGGGMAELWGEERTFRVEDKEGNEMSIYAI